jgi:hypothetical protein
MSYTYSLGISFNTNREAQKCLMEFNNSPLVLSDSVVIDCATSVVNSCYPRNIPKQYICVISPKGMRDSKTNKKLFERPYFYEIRDLFYQFLFQLQLPFNYALWEMEGADRILTDDLATELKRNGIGGHYGLGKDELGDPNAHCFSGFGSSYYQDKRYLDGLVIAESKFPGINIEFPDFEEFKSAYNWLPVKIKFRP